MTSTVTLTTQNQTSFVEWRRATWQDYVGYRDNLASEQYRLFFHQGYLLITEMGWEGINHATICDLFTAILYVWFSLHPDQVASSIGRCLLEKSQNTAGAPDLVLYLGDDYPRWQAGQPRRVDLSQWRIPDLVGEISDTILASDLDEKKQLYAALGIPEYWVIDVRGSRVFVFVLQDGKYQLTDTSEALKELPVDLLEQTIAKLETDSNISAAQWFSQQVMELKV
ncbi:Uma2 family endonuclease [Leptothoe spongobia]|uniref:Uma2 family endonuclease n=1 Tax=Leptothoe spongobia TAU-MAC 1115 TaxID=1967444 RepID=A0A947DIW0_9CYAN|nr:Uma2 family endonuclease [Leptothoe spongobia]MBT9316821.1 Uma2 family endonuclease [Leptothoe spongobia TAU-MAC 1115]